MEAICADFAAEANELDAIVSAPGADPERPTPAPGWTIGDQISHLWFFDLQAISALEDPEAFIVAAERLIADGGTEQSVEAGRTMSPDDLVAGWRAGRRRLVDTAVGRDPSERIPWFGPPMSARSFVTARLMETWAHGQDIVDALGVERAPSDRLRHVAHIGVRARPFSYLIHGRPLPDTDIRVELSSPRGESWEWGPADASDRVSGAALDFCLVVTRRRHPDDVGLTVVGDAAAEWLSIAQAFAGPPGEGRRPGQFAR